MPERASDRPGFRAANRVWVTLLIIAALVMIAVYFWPTLDEYLDYLAEPDRVCRGDNIKFAYTCFDKGPFDFLNFPGSLFEAGAAGVAAYVVGLLLVLGRRALASPRPS